MNTLVSKRCAIIMQQDVDYCTEPNSTIFAKTYFHPFHYQRIEIFGRFWYDSNRYWLRYNISKIQLGNAIHVLVTIKIPQF
ncbi:MAG: hypothetical protein GY820_02085 [Gammaproteobacteria bacterium]|nr:hypothetical protein [Gammaproteobacteria bacterium]